jgi:hypothetical protein
VARWIISPVVGDGTARVDVDSPATTGPYRPKAADYATAWGCIIPTGSSWCFVRASAGDLAAADADPDLIVLPDLQLDDVLTLAQRTWLITRLDSRGFASGWVTAGITVREVLRTIGRWLEASFDVDWIRGGD